MKARDIIPGWPRGKSQRRCWPSAVDPEKPLTRPWFKAYGGGIADLRYWDDWYDEQKEERRKLAMMEAYWAEKMNQAADTVDRDPHTRVAVYGFVAWVGRRGLILFMERMRLHGIHWHKASSDMFGTVTIVLEAHGR